jgi:DNA-binding NtrC family response regulator
MDGPSNQRGRGRPEAEALWEDSLDPAAWIPGPGLPPVPLLLHSGASRPLGAHRGFWRIRESLSIGRSARDERDWVCLGDDEAISREQLRIVARARSFLLEDLGARDGTYVDGTRLVQARPIDERGATLVMGRSVLHLRMVDRHALEALVREHHAPLLPMSTLSARVALLHDRVRDLSRGDEPVFLEGAPGTGRTTYAELIHRLSRREGRFVMVDAADLADARGLARLLGEPNAGDAGESQDEVGRLRGAAGGTLFLHRLDRVPLDVQARLAEVLRPRRTLWSRPEAKATRFRLIASGAKPLQPREGTPSPYAPAWRDVFTHPQLRLPALAHRLEDLGGLCAHHLSTRRGLSFSSAAWTRLWNYAWPGDLAQLVSECRAFLLRLEGEGGAGDGDGLEVQVAHLPAFLRVESEDRGAEDPDRTPTPPPVRAGAARAVTMAHAVEVLSRQCKRPLTPRMQKILELTARGYGRKSIASELRVAVSTVTNQLHNAAAHIGCPGDLEAMVRRVVELFEDLANAGSGWRGPRRGG